MSDNNIPRVVLPDGNSMPVIGLGTSALQTPGEVTKTAVLEAIKVGYRHFDTASLYGTEQPLGEAMQEALKLGLVGSRDELFITSKLWFIDAHPDRVVPALQKSLGLLKLEYVDLYLIHMPFSSKPESNGLFPSQENIAPLDIKGVWSAIEDCKKLGLAKSIGVSNFPVRTLDALLSVATIPPCLNQVEMNPTCQQKELKAYCKEKDILITAYSPLGAPGSWWGNNRIMDNETLNDIAKSHGKTVAQVALRWLYEQGVGFIAKSFNKERMKQNLEIFDWSLSEHDLEKISKIKQIRLHQENPMLEYIA
ncbi:non-functional NADPH-dependent codeinone reductase 2-like [Prosopis cineraria]|uniref:non-functional NADPH-dependent codeinone reductase 2-like n=1 Tax=Prosopis cineraria TaxID=364024 RepID=UPI002410049D|nr:non-functional NADPH-dependent codeinone reductase 2-like [Prosopis cineraria]